ncbi:phospholipase D family protein [Sansalvadorimonas sp. 2012CJ34-2]|uniref:Phospholipase D family protein n=1 Tax=Parendozoicomonas callyspongiae TaxID=2942213 RepID=A0ABT0PLM0_9GAMM|nr:phospholipase D family protein [Sansalvadorimonas sp. 2012CJ34-2]MCL6272151.1 phospholipase D family protein [Sansalvadorimonas sp. 2012CJ34-2]
MKICSKPCEIRGAINRVRASQIAVAFVGAGWNTHIKTDNLSEVVVSTMLGSNPRAIEELMDTLGHENVHLLDNLHTKMYLGGESVFLGSANLSDNGLSDQGHHEAGVELTDEDEVKKAKSIFKRYRKEAEESYPTKVSKMRKLEQMYKNWQEAVSSGTDVEEIGCTDSPLITKCSLSSLDNVHIAWFTGEGGKFNEEVIREAIPEAEGTPLPDYFTNSTHFLEYDKIKEGDWIILWRCNQNGSPRANGDICWLYVDKVVPNGIRGDGKYTKLAAQTRTDHRNTEPFLLNTGTKEAIRKVLDRDEFSDLRWSEDDEHWSVEPADTCLSNFLQAVISEMEE